MAVRDSARVLGGTGFFFAVKGGGGRLREGNKNDPELDYSDGYTTW